MAILRMKTGPLAGTEMYGDADAMWAIWLSQRVHGHKGSYSEVA